MGGSHLADDDVDAGPAAVGARRGLPGLGPAPSPRWTLLDSWTLTTPGGQAWIPLSGEEGGSEPLPILLVNLNAEKNTPDNQKSEEYA